MKRVFYIILTLLFLSACRPTGNLPEDNANIWQEQYDLGIRYLSEGNYEEAIIAFTAAIEIDQKQALAYVGRGDAYVLSGETEEKLTAAQADYERAIELDEFLAEAYLGLADVYIRQGDYDKALEILRQGLQKIGENQEISGKIGEMENGNISDSSGKIWRETSYGPDEELKYVYDYTYNSRGVEIGFYCTAYAEDEEDYSGRVEEFDSNGYPYRLNYYGADGKYLETYDLMTYNDKGQEIERNKYSPDGSIALCRFYYDEQGNETKLEIFENNELIGYVIYTYDESGKLTGSVEYTADGEIEYTTSYN